jgi:hypothetical protein
MYWIGSNKGVIPYVLCAAFCVCILHAGAVSMHEGRLIPKLMNYQGYITDTLDIPIDDTLDMTFKIFDAVSSGNELWSEAQLNVPVERGVFSVILGESTQIPDSVFSDFTSTWLELTLEGPQTLVPRTRITAVGYAYTSTYSDTAAYAQAGVADNDWTVIDSVLYTGKYWGIARGGAGNVLYGDSAYTHINLGIACTTGTDGQTFHHCTVSGGRFNTSSTHYATVGGGRDNAATFCATVSGGSYNAAGDQYTTVGGGDHNAASGIYATIGGGYYNVASDLYATVGGGCRDTASGAYATVGGGSRNTASWSFATVSGGYDNTASKNYATAGGGYQNTVDGYAATIGGGQRNVAAYPQATISGGGDNFAAGYYAVIPGGYADTIDVGADYSYLFGINSNLTQDSTFMVDMPHIRFGDETSGYEFPAQDGNADQVLVTDGSGQVSWSDAPLDNDWTLSSNVLYTGDFWGIARGGAGNTLYGDSAHTHVNLGNYSTTGTSGQHHYYCTVGGGFYNTATKYHATVGGGRYNVASGTAATVSGGDGNDATHDHSTVGGGQSNTAGNVYATVGGGVNNTVTSWDATVGGGRNNTISGYAGVIAGGYENYVAGDFSAICGGRADSITATADYSYLFGITSTLTQDSTFMVDVPHIRFGDETNGYEFPATDGGADQVLTTNGSGQLSWSDISAAADTDWVISGNDMYAGVSGNVGIGVTNPSQKLDVSGNVEIAATDSYLDFGSDLRQTINFWPGGANALYGIGMQDYTQYFRAAGNFAWFIGGTHSDSECSPGAGGTVAMVIKRPNSYVGIGTANPLSQLDVRGNICGGTGDTVNALYCGILAGYGNYAGGNPADSAAVICGGYNNTACSTYTAVVGGLDNTASGVAAVVAGGSHNNASGSTSYVGGGSSNTASGSMSVVGGGALNVASNTSATVGGGIGNTASGSAATVAGGEENTASVIGATVGGGYSNIASHQGATISGGWDNSAASYFSAIPGGASNNITSSGDYSMAFGIGVYVNNPYRVMLFRGAAFGRLGVNRDDNDGGVSYPIHVGTTTSNGNGAHLTGGGVWTNGSSRSFKEDFQVLEGTEVLDRITAMQVTRWKFKGTDEKHIGPVAEDFYEAFGCGTGIPGEDSRYLAAGDVAGVSLIAVQELVHLVNELQEENVALQKRIEMLEKSMQ